jgi:hypothetical protein
METNMWKTDLKRRRILQSGGAAALASALPLAGCGTSPDTNRDTNTIPGSNPPPNPTIPAQFLTAQQHETLTAFVERLIPTDISPGAAAAGCADFIDAYLAAFQTSPAFIYAGAPFSTRGGHPVNEFEAFVPLDRYEELAWRIVIEGSQGIPEREVNGPVIGLQKIYTEGLEQLDVRAQQQGAASFAELSPVQQDLLVNDVTDAKISELVDVAFLETLNAMYGPPEYRGNQDLIGWEFTDYDGDVQPRGFTAEQVVNADTPGLFDALLPPSFHEGAENQSAKATKPGVFNPKNTKVTAPTFPIYPSTEDMASLQASSEGRLSKLRQQMRRYQVQLPTGKA